MPQNMSRSKQGLSKAEIPSLWIYRKIDGQEIENGSVNNLSISVGSGKFMAEFEDR